MSRSNSPTFVATFADGITTRMTTWHDAGRKTLDLKRAVRLARHAYFARMKKEPPAISAARLEDGAGAVLERYDAKQIAEATHEDAR